MLEVVFAVFIVTGICLVIIAKIHSGIAKLRSECEVLREKLNFYCGYEKKYNELHENFIEKTTELAVFKNNLENEKQNLAEKIALMEKSEIKMREAFKCISADALSENNKSFLQLAAQLLDQVKQSTLSEINIGKKDVNNLVEPIKKALEQTQLQINELEKSRVGAYEALKQQLGDLIITQNSLKAETSNLISALRSPVSRGRWGEMQLKRVVELSGMLPHCDFQEQVFSKDYQGQKIRPDMVIHLPGGKHIVVDAKVPLTAYLKMLEQNDENIRKEVLKEHAKAVRSHCIALSDKQYWQQFQPGPEFVILFLPGEIFFSSALEGDSSLIEFAIKEHVIIATPATLLSLLHAVAIGWRQESMAAEAKHIVQAGQEFYKRLCDMSEHFVKLGKHLGIAVDSYNSSMSSLERRVLVTARKFKQFSIGNKELPQIDHISNIPKSIDVELAASDQQ